MQHTQSESKHMKLYKHKNKGNCSGTAEPETHKALYSVVELWITQEGTGKAVSVCVCVSEWAHVCDCMYVHKAVISDG